MRFYFKTEIEASVLGSWTHEITGYMIMKKSSFIVWWLVIELLIELLKAHLLLNKTKQKTIISPDKGAKHRLLRKNAMPWWAASKIKTSICGKKKIEPSAKPITFLSQIYFGGTRRGSNKVLIHGAGKPCDYDIVIGKALREEKALNTISKK